MEISYFARNIYGTETITLELGYIENLIFLENNIVWFSNSLNVQSTNSSVGLYNTLSNSRFFFNFLITFCTSFWKVVHNSKEIVNLQVLFVWTVGYVNIKSYPLTDYFYIFERANFIYKLFILFVSTFSLFLFLCTVSWR